ncbi:hypothetical protein AZI86_03340 [Bdellovibrio bacteriovorus]|uniref:Soluble ligand binding domain-containing protein n=1 Tax=Bdellovibrio bacteriovorus TaxID=959 RepID=A0A150WNN1_BDEBC|nr:SLBB domain-containing protein [Bdellovibrio bacteriovorus]KYG66111.1 hypothetical protein AZI86_03340 [Bdellovibrio bacteriovorus]
MFVKFLRLTMAFVFAMMTCLTTAQAQDIGLLNDIKPPQQSAEYIYRSSPKESMINVQLLGAVGRPGIYYIPANTDLLKLITLAGGTTSGGDLGEILVRKMEPKTWANLESKAINEYQGAFEIDAEKLIKYGGARNLKLQQDDFIYVPPRTSWVSNETARGITVVSMILSIALTAILIDNNSRK